MKHVDGLIESSRSALMDWAVQVADEFQALGPLMARLATPEVGLAALRLAGLILAVLVIHEALRRLTRRRLDAVIERTAAKHSGARPVRGLLTMGVVLLRGVLTLGLAAAVGVLISFAVFPDAGAGGAIATAFLRAFVTVHLIRLALEIFLQPEQATARPLPLESARALHWQRHIMGVVQVGAYGILLIAPAIQMAAEGIGQLVAGLVVLAVALSLLRMVRALRGAVRQWLAASAKAKQGGILRPILGVLAPLWHWLAGLYVLIISALAIAAPSSVVNEVLLASLLSIGLGLGAGFLGHWLSVLSRARIPIPARFGHRFAMLQVRLRTWFPRLLAVGHLLLGLAVIGGLLEIWGLADVGQWLASDTGQALAGALTGVIGILLLALAAWLFSVSWIEDRLNPETGHGAPGAREKTLLSLFRNAIAIAIITLAGMVALSEIGMNIGPLIAGAGVLGLAIGFGAQKLVQDIITGVFIQLEDAIHKEDFITAAGISGTVERLSIRSLGLRDLSGTLHIVPFSSVDTVSNYTRDFGYHLAEYGVAYRENIGEVVEHLNVAYERLCADEDISGEVTGPLEVDGVTALADSAVNVRVRIRTTPGMQWAVGRAYNRIVKEVFDEVGIEIPFPHMTLYFGEDKQGVAPPAHIALEDKTNQET
ncbi:MAG: mechanosensitive ion channel [Spiribacter salinus]|uniref:Mechanosensitive ion channel n=1 Tax=Spiribacter salinus TaxID=1335746 RepID=A0A540VUR6_9GAMM|nr:MAG: mechanosensitive ion channel [Spiribacter salinus]